MLLVLLCPDKSFKTQGVKLSLHRMTWIWIKNNFALYRKFVLITCSSPSVSHLWILNPSMDHLPLNLPPPQCSLLLTACSLPSLQEALADLGLLLFWAAGDMRGMQFWRFSTLFKGASVVLWGFPGYQNTGLEPRSLHFSARSSTDWTTVASRNEKKKKKS